MKLSSGIICLFLFLIYFSSVAKGSLVEVDYLTSGDKLLTKDLNTGLYWLDLNQTTNISYQDMLFSLEPGGLFDGFRYASVADVNQLQESAGLFSGLFFTANPYYRQRIEDLISKVGITRENSGSLYSNGITKDPFTPTTNTNTNDRILRGFSLTLGSSAYQGVVADGIASESIGSWLVRDTITTVPVPGSILLFLSGLSLLMIRKKMAR
ncbi:MAG: PEP-CTERM sorting domain-containing protein [Candidatus Thiodiazotropha endolucinida]